MADTLCHMFCGWRLIASKPALVALGSGQLSIDALSGECRFEGAAVADLPIAAELRSWLADDLARHGIPVESLRLAHLRVRLTFTRIPWHQRTPGEQFFAHQHQIVGSEMQRGAFECESEVATDEAVYRTSYSEVEEWPVGWPVID